ncbi:acyl-CoA dehydrogenase family protein [Zavarzinia sp. CC-PAN008]|uniref:acyl-CoA dehydrogenase family protein n=1 Tax=Zavarzinia sp. CC-PAN008 TaxID=3243332 RepID=UPI003F744FB1
MSYFLTDDQKQIQDTARRFAQKDVEPLAQQIDREERTPRSLVDKAAELGFFGLTIPEEYGGTDQGITTACVVLEEIAKASPAFAGLLSVEMILCPGVVNLLGNAEQKQRILPKSATGERLMAFSQTEPAGAGNTAVHQTKLVAHGNGYRLNGAKLFCTQGEGETYLVMARTSRDGQEGYGVVIVEKEQPGFSVDSYEDKLGWRGTNTGPISFTDIDVAPENVLGDLLTGNADFAPVNQVSFMGHAATSLGCAEGLFDKTLAYIKQRQLYGAPMHNLSPISFKMADCFNKIEACRSLLYNATRMADEKTMTLPMGSMCKAYVCETAFEVCNTLLQFWGGSGMMDSTGVNRYFRDARTKLIAEGATEMHTSGVAHLVLGLSQPMYEGRRTSLGG